jgi:hypothetical protein
MTSYPKPETTGVILAFLAAAFATLFPIIVSKGVQTIPAVTFAGLSVLLAAIAAFVYAIFQGRLHELKYKKAYRSLVLVALCNERLLDLAGWSALNHVNGLGGSRIDVHIIAEQRQSSVDRADRIGIHAFKAQRHRACRRAIQDIGTKA